MREYYNMNFSETVRDSNNAIYVKNDVIFEPPSMRACSSTPPKLNQDFVKEYNRTPLIVKVRK